MKNFLSLPSLLMGINFTILSFMLLVRALLKMLTKEASDGIVTLGLGFCASILAQWCFSGFKFEFPSTVENTMAAVMYVIGLPVALFLLALVIVRFAIFPYVKGIQNNCNEKENSNTEK